MHFDGHAGADVGGDRNAGYLFAAELPNDDSERKSSSLLLREFTRVRSHLAMINDSAPVRHSSTCAFSFR